MPAWKKKLIALWLRLEIWWSSGALDELYEEEHWLDQYVPLPRAAFLRERLAAAVAQKRDLVKRLTARLKTVEKGA